MASTIVARPSAPTAGLDRAPGAAPEREFFLDAVRTAALVRVVLWHTTGAVVLTYVVAAVPTMFFVSGSLLAKSLRRGARRVVLDRARRILVPLWAFAAVAWAAMGVAHAVDGTASTALPWNRLLFWLVPLDDPTGSRWEGGYLSSPLWYLRALLWLILLAPALLWLVRRLRTYAFVLPLGALVGLEVSARTGRFTGSAAWKAGDLALYGTFLMLGFVHRDGGLDRLTPRRWLAGAALAGTAATAWCLTQPVPGGVVNDSHPAHLLVGLTWLCLFFAARPRIEAAGRLAPVRDTVAFVSRRTMTIYLWHSTAAVVSFLLLRHLAVVWPRGTFVVVLVAMTGAVTTVAVLAFGWIEDLANRRAPALWPGHARRRRSTGGPLTRRAPRPAIGAATAGVLVLTATACTGLVPTGGGAAAALGSSVADGAVSGQTVTATATKASIGLRVPSQQPLSASATAASAAGAVAPSATVPAGAPSSLASAAVDAGSGTAQVEAALAAAVGAWARQNGVPGVSISVQIPGVLSWHDAFGTDTVTGETMTTSYRTDIASITKTFTAALVWQLVDAGLVEPDAPLPVLAKVPAFPASRFTVRELLAHTTGLMNYRDTPAYVQDPGSITSPQAALAAVASQPLLFPTGSRSAYSSTNYLVLGFLLEQVTGRDYDSLLAGLAADAGLGVVRHDPPSPGEPRFSTAGIELTTDELAQWAIALFHDDAAELTTDSLVQMTTIDPATSLGEGVWGYCPCTADLDGSTQFTALGHSGSNTQLEYMTDTGMAVAVALGDSVWEPGDRQNALFALMVELRRITASLPAAPGVVR